MSKLIEKLSYKLNLQILIFAFLMPFVDTWEELIGGRVEIFGIALIEIFKILAVNYLLVLAIYANREKIRNGIRKRKALFIAVGAFYVFFLVFHLINVASLDPDLINGLSNSIFTEIYYLYRTYGLCLTLLAAVMLSSPEGKATIGTVSLICFVISLAIVVSNLLKIGYIAYDSYLPQSEMISGSIIDWFSTLNASNADFYTSKAWFFSTNQLSLVLIITVMISALYLAETRKKVLFFTFPVKLLASLMISTKACFFGIFISLIALAVLTTLCDLIRRKKVSFLIIGYAVVLIVAFRALAPYSPINYKLNVFNNISTDSSITAQDVLVNSNNTGSTGKDPTHGNSAGTEAEALNGVSLLDLAKKENLTETEQKLFVNQLKSSYGTLGIHPLFIERYPVEENIGFWKSSLLLPQSQRANYRNFKILIYKDVLKKNNNPFMDLTFGYGYVSNMEYIEKDYTGQVAFFGITGALCLIGPYLAVFLASVFYILRDLKNRFTLRNLFLAATAAEVLLVVYIAGHGFGNLFPMTFLTLTLKCLYDSSKGKQ